MKRKTILQKMIEDQRRIRAVLTSGGSLMEVEGILTGEEAKAFLKRAKEVEKGDHRVSAQERQRVVLAYEVFQKKLKTP